MRRVKNWDSVREGQAGARSDIRSINLVASGRWKTEGTEPRRKQMRYVLYVAKKKGASSSGSVFDKREKDEGMNY